jgi:hypothetical protein
MKAASIKLPSADTWSLKAIPSHFNINFPFVHPINNPPQQEYKADGKCH